MVGTEDCSNHIKTSFKQWMVRLALGVLRGLVYVKRRAGTWLRPIALPIFAVGRFLVLVVGVPLYRLYFFLRRGVERLLGLAKNRLSFLAGSSRLIHVTTFGIVIIVVWSSIAARQVRADTFGRQSMLYALVSSDGTTELETEGPVVADTSAPSSYLADDSIGALSRQDLAALDEDYASLQAPSSATNPGVNLAPARSSVQTYQVADGDTLGTIAEKFNLDIETILWANNLSLSSTIRPGENLTILPVDGVLYSVKKGDTVGKIANVYGTDAGKIVAFNNLPSDGTLTVGASLVLPDAEPPAEAAPLSHIAPIQSLFTPPTSSGGGYATLSNGEYAPSGFARKGPVVFAAQPNVLAAEASQGGSAAAGQWVWPTDWHIITQYFSWKHTGVDIGGSFATHNYAAADGTVIYAGWRTGYGMTVEVDNGGGYITRYAHNSELFVKAGDVVKAGEPVGETGETGNATGPHLHFEIIKDGKFQNPLEYIR